MEKYEQGVKPQKGSETVRDQLQKMHKHHHNDVVGVHPVLELHDHSGTGVEEAKKKVRREHFKRPISADESNAETEDSDANPYRKSQNTNSNSEPNSDSDSVSRKSRAQISLKHTVIHVHIHHDETPRILQKKKVGGMPQFNNGYNPYLKDLALRRKRRLRQQKEEKRNGNGNNGNNGKGKKVNNGGIHHRNPYSPNEPISQSQMRRHIAYWRQKHKVMKHLKKNDFLLAPKHILHLNHYKSESKHDSKHSRNSQSLQNVVKIHHYHQNSNKIRDKNHDSSNLDDSSDLDDSDSRELYTVPSDQLKVAAREGEKLFEVSASSLRRVAPQEWSQENGLYGVESILNDVIGTPKKNQRRRNRNRRNRRNRRRNWNRRNRRRNRNRNRRRNRYRRNWNPYSQNRNGNGKGHGGRAVGGLASMVDSMVGSGGRGGGGRGRRGGGFYRELNHFLGKRRRRPSSSRGRRGHGRRRGHARRRRRRH